MPRIVPYPNTPCYSWCVVSGTGKGAETGPSLRITSMLVVCATDPRLLNRAASTTIVAWNIDGDVVLLAWRSRPLRSTVPVRCWGRRSDPVAGCTRRASRRGSDAWQLSMRACTTIDGKKGTGRVRASRAVAGLRLATSACAPVLCPCAPFARAIKRRSPPRPGSCRRLWRGRAPRQPV